MAWASGGWQWWAAADMTVVDSAREVLAPTLSLPHTLQSAPSGSVGPHHPSVPPHPLHTHPPQLIGPYG